MKILGKILFFILLVSHWNCSEKPKEKEKHISVSTYTQINGDCIKNRDKEIIIEKILSSDDLQIYLKPLVEKSLEIQVLEDEFLTDNLDIHVNNQKVILLDSINSTERTFELRFPKIDCEAEQLSFAIWYEFEHASISGSAFKQNGIWKINVTGHGIVD